ncbi:MAG: hypothetical protein P8X55_08280 [Desulfosarcinaceae bacterium]
MLLFYAAHRSQSVEMLESIVSKKLPVHQVMYCTAIEAVEKRLRRPRQNLEIVLVLPRRDEATVAWAHKLGPRFIAYADNGLEQVEAVLDKMLGNIRPYKAIAGF